MLSSSHFGAAPRITILRAAMALWLIALVGLGWILVSAAFLIGACMLSSRRNAQLEGAASDEVPLLGRERPHPSLEVTPAGGQRSRQQVLGRVPQHSTVHG